MEQGFLMKLTTIRQKRTSFRASRASHDSAV